MFLIGCFAAARQNPMLQGMFFDCGVLEFLRARDAKIKNVSCCGSLGLLSRLKGVRIESVSYGGGVIGAVREFLQALA